jgi:hypothetical protein
MFGGIQEDKPGDIPLVSAASMLFRSERGLFSGGGSLRAVGLEAVEDKPFLGQPERVADRFGIEESPAIDLTPVGREIKVKAPEIEVKSGGIPVRLRLEVGDLSRPDEASSRKTQQKAQKNED